MCATNRSSRRMWVLHFMVLFFWRPRTHSHIFPPSSRDVGSWGPNEFHISLLLSCHCSAHSWAGFINETQQDGGRLADSFIWNNLLETRSQSVGQREPSAACCGLGAPGGHSGAAVNHKCVLSNLVLNRNVVKICHSSTKTCFFCLNQRCDRSEVRKEEFEIQISWNTQVPFDLQLCRFSTAGNI